MYCSKISNSLETVSVSSGDCARHYLGFDYYERWRRNKKLQFLLGFDGIPSNLGLASADFALEMRAVSMIQHHPRRKRLPLRLLYRVTYSGSDEPLRSQPRSNGVPEEKRQKVIRHLEEYTLAWGAWRRGELSPSEYLEAQHSLLTNLALDLAEGATTETKYPALIKKLRVPERWEQDCLDLGKDRNRVKHRGYRHEAERYVEKYEQMIYSVTVQFDRY